MATTPELSPVAEFARRHDPDRFLCALFAPVALREPLFALIAYNHERWPGRGRRRRRR
ncbi:hypothetical protein [Dankookia sp. P2]|uniref:hypothetical protein n=1 Tax=Dankookia sp. P2 TaxID=3423955 RepID=UPI003D66F554